jgi:hypothetical protein
MNDFRRLNQHSRPVNNNPSANNQQSRNIMIIHSLKTRIHVNNNPKSTPTNNQSINNHHTH